MEPHVVYVLILDGGYEGENFRGVYSTEEKAWAAHGRSGVMSRAVVAPVTIDAPAVYVDMTPPPAPPPTCGHRAYSINVMAGVVTCRGCGATSPWLDELQWQPKETA
jgi:hypothetical protein